MQLLQWGGRDYFSLRRNRQQRRYPIVRRGQYGSADSKAPPPYAAGALRKGCRHNPPCSVHLGCAPQSRHPFGIRRPNSTRTLASPWDPPFSEFYYRFSVTSTCGLAVLQPAAGNGPSWFSCIRTWDSPIFFDIPPTCGGAPTPGIRRTAARGSIYIKLFTCRCAALFSLVVMQNQLRRWTYRNSCQASSFTKQETFRNSLRIVGALRRACRLCLKSDSIEPIVWEYGKRNGKVHAVAYFVRWPSDLFRSSPAMPFSGSPPGSPAPGCVPCGPASGTHCHCTWDSPLSSAIRGPLPVCCTSFC